MEYFPATTAIRSRAKAGLRPRLSFVGGGCNGPTPGGGAWDRERVNQWRADLRDWVRDLRRRPAGGILRVHRRRGRRWRHRPSALITRELSRGSITTIRFRALHPRVRAPVSHVRAGGHTSCAVVSASRSRPSPTSKGEGGPPRARSGRKRDGFNWWSRRRHDACRATTPSKGQHDFEGGRLRSPGAPAKPRKEEAVMHERRLKRLARSCQKKASRSTRASGTATRSSRLQRMPLLRVRVCHDRSRHERFAS